MAASGPAFVRAIQDALGCATPTELSAELAELGEHRYAKIIRWRKGENEPDYEATMLMIERAGWLTPDAQKRLALAERHLAAAQEAAAEAARQAQQL